MSKLDKLKAWYTLDEAAARLTRKTGDQFAAADLVQFINDDALAVWMDARGRYAVSVAPVCSYYVDPKDNPIFEYLGRTAEESLAQVPDAQKTTAWQEWKHGPETLEVLSPILEVLTGPHRIDCREREDGLPITSDDPMRSAIRFLHGVLVFDDDALDSTESGSVWPGSLLQLVRRRAGCEPTPFPKIEDFEPDDVMPTRADLLVSNAEMARFEQWYLISEPTPPVPADKDGTTSAVPSEIDPGDWSSDPTDWRYKARAIADVVALEKYQAGQREITGRNIDSSVAARLEKDAQTHGNRGPRSAGSIRKYALSGWRFIPPSGANGATGAKVI